MNMTADSPSRRVAVATSPTARYDAFKCTLIARQRVVPSEVQGQSRDLRSERSEENDAVKLQRNERA